MPSKIEWTDETWNPITGCTKVSAGCKNCYAERIAKRFWGDRKFTDVQCHPERLEIPLHWKKPRRIFVCSMSDLFHPGASPDFVVSVFEIMTACPQHDFQVLTKRTERIAPVLFGEDGNWYLGGGDYLPNVWMGVTCEDQDTANKRIPVLFDSCPPLLPKAGEMGIVKRKEALRLAIAALQRDYRRWLFASDSEASDQKRVDINKAIVILDNMRRQKEMKL